MPKSKTIGGQYRYRCESAIDEYAEHNGKVVTVLSKEGVGGVTMYRIQARDGWTGQAHGDELRKVPSKRRCEPSVTKLTPTHTYTFDRGDYVYGIPVTDEDGNHLFVTIFRGRFAEVIQLSPEHRARWVKKRNPRRPKPHALEAAAVDHYPHLNDRPSGN